MSFQVARRRSHCDGRGDARGACHRRYGPTCLAGPRCGLPLWGHLVDADQRRIDGKFALASSGQFLDVTPPFSAGRERPKSDAAGDRCQERPRIHKAPQSTAHTPRLATSTALSNETSAILHGVAADVVSIAPRHRHLGRGLHHPALCDASSSRQPAGAVLRQESRRNSKGSSAQGSPISSRKETTTPREGLLRVPHERSSHGTPGLI